MDIWSTLLLEGGKGLVHKMKKKMMEFFFNEIYQQPKILGHFLEDRKCDHKNVFLDLLSIKKKQFSVINKLFSSFYESELEHTNSL